MKFVQTDGQTDKKTDGWTGRHDKANSRFSQVCQRTI